MNFVILSDWSNQRNLSSTLLSLSLVVTYHLRLVLYIFLRSCNELCDRDRPNLDSRYYKWCVCLLYTQEERLHSWKMLLLEINKFLHSLGYFYQFHQIWITECDSPSYSDSLLYFFFVLVSDIISQSLYLLKYYILSHFNYYISPSHQNIISLYHTRYSLHLFEKRQKMWNQLRWMVIGMNNHQIWWL